MTKVAETDPVKVKNILWFGYPHVTTGQFIELLDEMHYMNHGQPGMLGAVRAFAIPIIIVVITMLNMTDKSNSDGWTDTDHDVPPLALER